MLGNAAKMTTGRTRRVAQETEKSERTRKERDFGVFAVESGFWPLLREAYSGRVEDVQKVNAMVTGK